LAGLKARPRCGGLRGRAKILEGLGNPREQIDRDPIVCDGLPALRDLGSNEAKQIGRLRRLILGNASLSCHGWLSKSI
jgi:hypothetical protein